MQRSPNRRPRLPPPPPPPLLHPSNIEISENISRKCGGDRTSSSTTIATGESAGDGASVLDGTATESIEEAEELVVNNAEELVVETVEEVGATTKLVRDIVVELGELVNGATVVGAALVASRIVAVLGLPNSLVDEEREEDEEEDGDGPDGSTNEVDDGSEDALSVDAPENSDLPSSFAAAQIN